MSELQSSFFSSFFMGGFECSSHRRADGVRLDLIRTSGHERCVVEDYGGCAELGLLTIRDGLRWHRIERQSGAYDWSSWLPMLDAAERSGVQVIWDLFHYGFPDHLIPGSDQFVASFANFAVEAVRTYRRVTGRAAIVCPINEISYLTWAVNTGYFPRLEQKMHGWLKERLIVAALTASRAIREIDPDVRFVWAEPLINILPSSSMPEDCARAEEFRLGQFEAYDMLLGRCKAVLGGGGWAADVLGFNFYPDNQWIEGGSTIPFGHHAYRPLSDMLVEVYERFGKPIIISETGAERSARTAWFHYVCDEVREARARGVAVLGICIYPVTTFPGWDDSRLAEVGLFGLPQANCTRPVYLPLREELERQRVKMARD